LFFIFISIVITIIFWIFFFFILFHFYQKFLFPLSKFSILDSFPFSFFPTASVTFSIFLFFLVCPILEKGSHSKKVPQRNFKGVWESAKWETTAPGVNKLSSSMRKNGNCKFPMFVNWIFWWGKPSLITHSFLPWRKRRKKDSC
jgi:hypothetical protein